uniref:AlNc14C163G7820 protein n=1 Tax=Albugo laibachii Nc14 TaxID=890382 RepID=F0WMY3_9STRA|nr:AlNc14C163G7820 [Albugo laibachii Nc14]|eukprot:CCA22670.1 AlNc14C163G7820 [Albugo laibachii Nc14]
MDRREKDIQSDTRFLQRGCHQSKKGCHDSIFSVFFPPSVLQQLASLIEATYKRLTIAYTYISATVPTKRSQPSPLRRYCRRVDLHSVTISSERDQYLCAVAITNTTFPRKHTHIYKT